jgi:hypothetical protein
MKQTRAMSMIETVASTAVGFAVALATQIVVFPLFGFAPSLHQNLAITAIFTVVSVCRQFLMRRVFEALHIRRPLTPAMQAVIAERYRQIEAEGWSAEHDDAHAPGDLAKAGAVYATWSYAPLSGRRPPRGWPWARHWWKPADTRRNLVKAAALVLAEIEKLDRARRKRK